MRPLRVCAVFLLWVACGHPGGPGPGARPLAPEAAGPRSEFAEEDAPAPPYGEDDLLRALTAERAAEAAAAAAVAELAAREDRAAADEDRLLTLTADLGVRRRFLAALESCEVSGRLCPPRLDDPPWSYDPEAAPPRDPPLTATLRFDLASWRQIAAELYGRACACRTLACVDSLGAATSQLEGRPMPEVQGDEDATRSITRARECLFRLRGRPLRARAPRPGPD